MTFRGIVRNGKVELEDGAELAEGTTVDVNVHRGRSASRKAPLDPAFRLSELAVPSGRRDGAAEHDHYIYGTPKRATRRVRSKTKKPGRAPRGRSR